MGALALVLGTSGALRAGTRLASSSWEVSTSSSWFGGSPASARASADGNQYIGCELEWVGPTASTTVTNQPSNYGYCYARDAAGNSRGCYVTIKYGTAAGLLSTINQNSYISVNFFNMPDVAYCGSVTIYDYSYGPVMTN
jgi:hypothetical protein